MTAHNLPDGENTYAFKYGPYVLSAELGTHNMTQGTTGVNVSIPAAAEGDETYTVGSDSVQDFMADINAHMVRGEDGKFTLACENGTLTYSYHFRQHTQRYGIYFRFAASGAQEPEVTNPTNAWERCDTVQPGYGQYESDELHDMQTGGSQGVTSDGTYRYATEGGWFSYRMIVRKGVRNRLLVSFRKADNGKTIRITAGDTELYSATLDYAGDEAEYQVEVMIPVSVANGAPGRHGERRRAVTCSPSLLRAWTARSRQRYAPSSIRRRSQTISLTLWTAATITPPRSRRGTAGRLQFGHRAGVTARTPSRV